MKANGTRKTRSYAIKSPIGQLVFETIYWTIDIELRAKENPLITVDSREMN